MTKKRGKCTQKLWDNRCRWTYWRGSFKSCYLSL